MRPYQIALMTFGLLFFHTVVIADGPLIAQQQLIVREVAKHTADDTIYQNGTLTFDGKDLIIVVPHEKLSLYSVKDLTERVVLKNPLIINARSDSSTGGIFVQMESEKIGSKDEGKSYLHFFDLLYFANTNDLLNWKPKWTKKRMLINSERDFKLLRTQWIPGIEQFSLNRDGANGNEFSFIDSEGNDIGTLKVPGQFCVGFDTSENGLEVYYEHGAYLMRGILNSKQNKLVSSARMNPSTFRGMLASNYNGRHIRLRGLRQGDVRRSIELGAEPTYNQHKDHEKIGLEPAHLESLKFYTQKNGGRRWEFGWLSYAESPKEYEIVTARPNVLFPNTADFPSFVYRRAGDLIMLPRYRVVDAVLSDETWVVSMMGERHVNRHVIETKFYVCTLKE